MIDNSRVGSVHLMHAHHAGRVRRPFLPASVLRPLGLVAVVCVFYHGWLQPGPVASGDLFYLAVRHLKEEVPFPSLWESSWSTGVYNILQAPMFPLYALQGAMAWLHMDWSVSERAVWIFPAVVVPCLSTYVLALALFRQPAAAVVSALAAVMNSYIYLLYERGQFGVAMAYGCMPLALWAFIRGQRRGTVAGFLLTGLVIAVQAMYDIRSTYITLGVIGIYGLYSFLGSLIGGQSRNLASLLKAFGLPQVIVALTVLFVLHLWWILPAIIVHAPSLPAGYTNVRAAHLLSFMNLSNGLSLFHPFWYADDLHFYPIGPQFFIIPLFIFMLLLRWNNDRRLLFLATVALVAIFLVKGSNSPGGIVYDWLFTHLPGFSLFRDPSKFYQPLALAYSLLLGLAATTCCRIVGGYRRALRPLGAASVTALFLVLAVFPAYPALWQQARGALIVSSVPREYAQVNNLIDGQHRFFRVLWLPAGSRFVTASSLHPALDNPTLASCCIRVGSQVEQEEPSWLSSPFAPRVLEALSVRYVIVPDDAPEDTVPGRRDSRDTSLPARLSATRHFLSHLRELRIGHLHIFVNPAAYPLLFTVLSSGAHGGVPWCAANTLCQPTARSARHIDAVYQPGQNRVGSFTGNQSWYDVSIRAARRPLYLVFQQAYDPNWIAFVIRGRQQPSRWTTLLDRPLPHTAHLVANGYANTWLIRQTGTYHVVLEYWPQRLVLLGWFIALVALLGCGIYFLTRVVRPAAKTALLVCSACAQVYAD